MKNQITTQSKHKYRQVRRQLAITAVVIGIATIAIAGTASASSLSESFNFNMFQFKEKQLFDLGKLSQEKTKKLSSVEKKVEVVVSEAEKVKEATVETEKEVESLQASVDKLADMFVKIDKYAPDAAGNAYSDGNCTKYVKDMRPDISSYWGNAKFWYENAKAQGWNVGHLPKKGAIATTTEGWAGHTAYVIGVSADQSSVTIREMNYNGLYRMNTRTVPASDFRYIYELN